MMTDIEQLKWVIFCIESIKSILKIKISYNIFVSVQSNYIEIDYMNFSQCTFDYHLKMLFADYIEQKFN